MVSLHSDRTLTETPVRSAQEEANQHFHTYDSWIFRRLEIIRPIHRRPDNSASWTYSSHTFKSMDVCHILVFALHSKSTELNIQLSLNISNKER